MKISTARATLILILCCAGVARADPPGSPLGAEFQVNTFTAGDQQLPAVARAPNGDFVVVWDGDGEDGSLSGIYAQRYAADGTPQGAEFRVNTFTRNRQTFPAIAMDASGDFVVVWESDSQTGLGLGVYAQRFAADGTPLGVEFKVNSGARDTYPLPVVAMNAAGDFLVAWLERENLLAGAGKTQVAYLYVQRFLASGTAVGAPILVDSSLFTKSRFACAAMNAAGNFAVAWDADGQGGALAGIFARGYAPDGTALSQATRVSPYGVGFPVDQGSRDERPVIAMAGNGSFVVAWENLPPELTVGRVYARRMSLAGTPLAGAVRVGGAGMQRNPSVGMDPAGQFVVAAQGNGIYAQRYAANGAAAGPEFRVDSAAGSYTQLNAGAAMDAVGNFVVTWQNRGQDGDGRGIFARRYAGP